MKALLGTIALYRLNNNLPPGDPPAEVEGFYSQEFPWLVSKVGVTVSAAPSPVDRWLSRLWANPPKVFVETVEADRRRAHCAACPHCHDIAPPASYKLAVLASGRSVGNGICRITGGICGLLVWIDNPDMPNVPNICWGSKPSS